VSKPILITGATGLVGANLTRLLVARGERVRVLVRPTSDLRALVGVDVERVTGDVTDPASVRSALAGCDRVFHVAALVSNWNGYLPLMERVNVEGTRHVLEAAMALGVERVVHVSTNGALGMPRGERPADETEPYDYDQYRNAYSATKHRAHRLATDFAAKGLDVVIGCPTYMFGAWDVRPTSGTMILEVKAGKTPFAPPGGNNIVDVLDVCEGLRLACERGRKGEAYLLCNGAGNLSYFEIFSRIADVVGARRPFATVPRFAAMAAGRAMDVLAKLRGTAPEVNSASTWVGCQRQHYTPEKAVEQLGMPQSDVDAAIRRAFEWFAANGYLERNAARGRTRA
jgi:dihydroflavonol-4-reductase